MVLHPVPGRGGQDAKQGRDGVKGWIRLNGSKRPFPEALKFCWVTFFTAQLMTLTCAFQKHMNMNECCAEVSVGIDQSM